MDFSIWGDGAFGERPNHQSSRAHLIKKVQEAKVLTPKYVWKRNYVPQLTYGTHAKCSKLERTQSCIILVGKAIQLRVQSLKLHGPEL